MIVGLASLVLWPDLKAAGMKSHEEAYPMMIMLLPAGIRGLLVGSLLAAFMSTVDTHLNWGASYLTVDFYQSYIRTDCGKREGVWISRGFMLLLMVICGVAAYFVKTVFSMWVFVALLGAGSGLIMILRWFWWRINAWSEITVLAVSAFVASSLQLTRRFFPEVLGDPVFGYLFKAPYNLMFVACISLPTSLLVTWLTRPSRPETLIRFYRKVRPGGPGWRPVAKLCPDVRTEGLGRLLICWGLGSVFIFAAMFGIGALLLGQMRLGDFVADRLAGAVMLGVAAACAALFFVMYPRANQPKALSSHRTRRG